ncbi:DASH complex subunit dam1 [Thecaphora frezii]
MSTTRRPTTPLRRISRGSLNALSHSRGPGAATPLSFLERALGDLVDETSWLQSNMEQVENIQDALGTFNENFAMYLYGLKMNAWCVEWDEAPEEENFERAEQRRAQQAEQRAAEAHLQSTLAPSYSGASGGHEASLYGPSSTASGGGPLNPADQTYVTADDESVFPDPINVPASSATAAAPLKSALKPALKKPATSSNTAAAGTRAGQQKGKITLAQKKKREAYADEIIETMPLEFRGSDPKANAVARNTIVALIAAASKGLRAAELVKPPEMTQAKVNKTLIALVAAKHVTKASNNGVVYRLDPARHPSLP